MEEEKKKTAREIIENYDGPKVRIMEVCGTHTHEIFRLGIRKLLPPQVELISGPGCPVCVTPVGFIDEAIWLALEKGVTICTFGDLVRVPGSEDEALRSKRKKEQRYVSYILRQMQKNMHQNIRRSRWFFFRWALKRPLRQSVFLIKKRRKTGIMNYSLLKANKTNATG